MSDTSRIRLSLVKETIERKCTNILNVEEYSIFHRILFHKKLVYPKIGVNFE